MVPGGGYRVVYLGGEVPVHGRVLGGVPGHVPCTLALATSGAWTSEAGPLSAPLCGGGPVPGPCLHSRGYTDTASCWSALAVVSAPKSW